MLADKIFVLSSKKIFRRIKDLIDIYYFSTTTRLEKNEIIEILNRQNKELDDFSNFINRIEDLRHSYNKFQLGGDVEKPDFDIVYNEVKNFISDFLPTK